jgi:hypothetical protein
VHSLTSALDGGEWSASRPGHFTPKEGAPVTHWIGGWVGSKAVLEAVVKRKIPSPAGNRTLEPLLGVLDICGIFHIHHRGRYCNIPLFQNTCLLS